ncbi:breast carcinoma-amplified sequence 1 isoform X3 [Hypomesus transpacificus]|uniref:breast carcinoma-amplified sequence 1 isoform X3 n=1 Tax=Hypomesus transpacificus TaxID=137520 RepID=UPI001F074CD0|nr:breast carcinoma-amplified sequence 1 isoform X3 [Hypomesus transpacificus]
MGNEQSTHKQNGLQTKVEEVTLQHQNGGLNGHAVKILENNVVSEVAVQKSCETPTSTLSLEIALDQTDDTSFPLAEENACLPENVEQKKETEIPSPDLPKKDPKETVEKVTFFDKLFKKKTQTPSIVENSQETNNPNENPSSPVADDPQSDLQNRFADASKLCEAEISTQSKSKHSTVEYALQPEAETPPSGSDPDPADQNTSLAFEVVKHVKVDASVAGAIASAVEVVKGKVEETEAELEAAESTVLAIVEAVEVEAIDEGGENNDCEEARIILEITSSGVMEVPKYKIKEESAAASGATMEFNSEGFKEESENESNRKDVAADAQPETTQDSGSSPTAEGTSPAPEVVVCVLDSSVVEAITKVEAMAAEAEDSPQPEKEKKAQLCKSDSEMDLDCTEEPDLTLSPSSAQESVDAMVESKEDSSAAVKLKEDGSLVLSKPPDDKSFSLLLNHLESACKQSFVKSQFKLVQIESVAQGYTICIKLEVDVQESNVKC